MVENPLHTIFSPDSVVVAGASNTPAKMGSIIYLNLIHGGFDGEVFALHPKEESVWGRKAYPSADSLPFAPDLAVLIVPGRHVPDLLGDLGRIGVRHAIVVTAGFGETGEEGRHLQDKMSSVSKKYGMRILGPNCLGAINPYRSFNTTAVPYTDKPGAFSLASQSGSYIAQTLGYLKQKGVRISKAISVGNESDIDLSDCLEYFAEDKDTKSIGLYIESIRDAGRFLNTAVKVSREKPIIVQYVGGTAAGARSGASHTGAMAGPDFLYQGLFEQAGILRADTIEDMFAIGSALSLSPPPKGDRIGILTNSGGPGTAMANALEKHGMEVPEFSETLQADINAHLPDHAVSRNPVDLTFHTGMETIARTLPEILLKSDEIDGLLIHGIMDTGFAELLYPVFKKAFDLSFEDFCGFFTADLSRLVDMPAKFDKPILVSSFMGTEDKALRTFRDRGIPTFDSPERAARAMAALRRYARTKAAPPVPPAEDLPPVPPEAAAVMEKMERESPDECSAKQLLKAYGIPVAFDIPASSIGEAVSAAREIGFPVVVKGLVPGVLHKTERNLVHTDCRNEKDVEKACRAMSNQFAKEPPSFLVSEKIDSRREFIAGTTRFEGFPPCILFGLGGVFSEITKDFSVRLAPLDMVSATDLIFSTRASKLLGPYRNMPEANIETMAGILVRLGMIALHFPRIGEIDLNPILIDGNAPKVADALVVLRRPVVKTDVDSTCR